MSLALAQQILETELVNTVSSPLCIKIFRDDVIKNAPERWRKQHAHYTDHVRTTNTEQLCALVWPFTAAQVNSIIGNDSWTTMCCDICHSDEPVLIRVGDVPDCDNRWQDICKSCVLKIAAEFDKQ